MDTEELIQNYIANRLSENERERVETLLKTDAAFQEAYKTHTALATAFQISNSNAIKERLKALDAKEINSNRKSFIQRTLPKIAIAAILIIGVFFMINVLNSSEDLYESYFEVCPNTYLPVTRGTDQQDAQYEAFKAYESDDFKKAETLFNEILKTDNTPTIQFYYAMSLLNQGQSEVALTKLQPLLTKTFDYQVESLWYTALIQLKNEDVENAKKNLKILQTLNSNFKQKEIQSILDILS